MSSAPSSINYNMDQYSSTHIAIEADDPVTSTAVVATDISSLALNVTIMVEPKVITYIFITLDIAAILFVIVSNILVLLLTTKLKSQQNSPNTYYVVSLTVANLAAGVLGLPAATFAHFGHEGLNGFCKAYQYLIGVTECAEVYSLVAIAIDRHRVVVSHRMASTDNKVVCIVVIIGIWLFALLYGISQAFIHEYSLISVTEDDNVLQYADCHSTEGNTLVKLIQIADLVLLFLLPLTIISVYYIRLVNFLQKEESNISSSSMRHRMRVIRTLLVLVTIFIVFNLPLLIFEVYLTYGQGFFAAEGPVREFLELLAFLNFGLNAFVYALLSTNFRLAFSKICPCVEARVYPSSESGQSPEVNTVFPKANSTAVPSTTVMTNVISSEAASHRATSCIDTAKKTELNTLTVDTPSRNCTNTLTVVHSWQAIDLSEVQENSCSHSNNSISSSS